MMRKEKGAVQEMTREEAIYQLIVPTVVCLWIRRKNNNDNDKLGKKRG